MHTQDYRVLLTSVVTALSMHDLEFGIADCPLPNMAGPLKAGLDAAEQVGRKLEHITIGSVVNGHGNDSEGDAAWVYISQQPVTAGQIVYADPRLRQALERAILALKLYYMVVERIAQVAEQAYNNGDLQAEQVDMPATATLN